MKKDLLNRLRDRNLPIADFRRDSISLAESIASELSHQIGRNQKIILVPILRAGLVLLPAFQEKFIEAPVGLLGIRRDEKTALPHLYYENLPPIGSSDHILILDPMLATGGSGNLALNILKERGAKICTVVSIISVQEGVDLIQKEHPRVTFYTVAMDDGLDEKRYIVPGLGDFGDRYFGTI